MEHNGLKPELLSPAGSWPALSSAIANGADAVYFGVKGINMRHMASNFHVNELPKLMEMLHEEKCRGYLTLNTVMLPDDIGKIVDILDEAKKAKIDGVILWDLSVLKLARERGLNIHISTQASVANCEAALEYARLGAERIVLARECSLHDIKNIITGLEAAGSSCWIECFVHGAMCVSVSGRCFLSQQVFGMSANQGKCLQPCRREYVITDKDEGNEYVLGSDYILSPKDLCMIEYVDQLMDAGIHSFKIEGRMRSPEYVATVTRCYRQAIDACVQGCFSETLKKDLLKELSQVYHRGFSKGFYFGQPDNSDWSKGLEHTHEKVYVGDIVRVFKKISVAEVRLRSDGLAQGEKILVIGKNTSAVEADVEEMQVNGKFVARASKGEAVGIKLPFAFKIGDKVFRLVKKKGLK